jgi:prepilin-type N-terminal cleavage/methylation domain-containing protein
MLATFRTTGGGNSAALSRAPRGSPAGERGFTLIELLIAMVAGIVVISATFALLESSQQVQARDSEWALVLQEDRAGLARMVHDLREATEVVEPSTGAAAASIVIKATIGGTKWQVKYECSVVQTGTAFTECVRKAAEEGKSLPATGARVASDITNGSSVFTYSPATRTEAKLVTAKLEIPAQGTLKQAGSTGYTHKVVLEDAAFMRNLYPEG